MEKKTKKRLLIFWVLFLTLYPMLYLCSDYLGMVEAEFDLLQNHYEIRSCGPPFLVSLWAETYERNGIAFRIVRGGCTSFVRNWIRGYNSVMKAKILNLWLEGFLGDHSNEDVQFLMFLTGSVPEKDLRSD